MELFYSACWFLTRVALVSFAVYFGLRQFIDIDAHKTIYQCVVLLSGVIIVNEYDTLIWPEFLSPIRVFPNVVLKDMRVLMPVTDTPRGDVALNWAKKYPDSDVIRIRTGPVFVLSPFSPRALRSILSTNQEDFEKPISGRNFLSRAIGNGLIFSEGATHARQRKSLTSSFRIQNIRALHELMLAKTRIMIACMEEQMSRDGKVEVSAWASKATLDIIGHSLMSQDFDALRTDHQPVHDAFADLTQPSTGLTQHLIWSMWLPKAVVEMLPTATNAKTERNVKIIRGVCLDSLNGREKSTTKSTVGSEILTSILEDKEADREEVIGQMMNFLGAGHETTATSVAWAVHLLTLPHNVRHQEALRQELRSHPDCVSSAQALETMPYLNAVCEETLRLYPPVSLTSRKAIRDTNIAGVPVPKGMQIVLFPWAVNRNPKYWGGAAADQFVPERWLEKGEDGQVRMNKHGGAESNYCQLTFLHGNRGCIGRDFAKAELRCIIASLFGTFKVSRLPGDDLVAEPAGSITIRPKGGLYVQLEQANVL